MGASNIWRIVLIAVLVIIALNIIYYLLGIVWSLLRLGLTIAIVVGVIWVIYHLLARRQTY
jgi:threonine/homoserine efflux transporter RhtA